MIGSYHHLAGYPMVHFNPGTLGWLGDDSSTLASLGFSTGEIQQITASYHSGALSAGGYQALVNGYIDPASLPDFLAADPGETGQVTTSGTGVAVSDVNATLAPGASPMVAAPLTWFGQSTIITGIPNWMIALAGVAAAVRISGLGGGARHHK